MVSAAVVPSRAVLRRASRTNAELGHENLGFLSEEYGLAPAVPPLTRMPGTHQPWDDVVAQLPDLFQTLGLRRVVDALPVLSAREADLPDAYLLRASSLMSMLAHAYVRVQNDEPASLPPAIQQPWGEVTQRLGRRAPVLSYIDLIVYNWRPRDPALPDPMRVENLDLLIPTVGNREEEIFYLTQVEILAQCAPIVSGVVRAQEAIVAGDVAALECELILIIERLRHAGEVSFQRIDLNPRGAGFVDPVVWAKTVAPFAVPITPGVQGPSGTSSPIFHVMDAFLGRAKYDSVLGIETLHIRDWYPQHWLDFLAALGQVSLRDFVARSGDRHLQGVFQALLDAYAGDQGFLGIHRLKVYGYLETAFKIGRSVTIGGFRGLFRERTWRQIDGELVNTRDERYLGVPAYHTFGTPLREPRLNHVQAAEQSGIRHVRFDVSHSGIQYRPGDRCGVLAENSRELIDRTLRALRASGEEIIRLDRAWQQAVRPRDGHDEATTLPLADLLRYGTLRPVRREVGKALQAITASSRLKQILDARSEDQWELWDLLDLLYESGFDTRRLWKAEPWEAESICQIVPPEDYRLYSIASAMPDESGDGGRPEERIELMVKRLDYRTIESATTRDDARHGTASNFLHRVMEDDPEDGRRPKVPLKVAAAPRFHLPADHTRPVVMFAAGAGIAPFHGFIEERARQADAGENWLFYGTRTPDEFFSRATIERFAGRGQLNVRVAFSRADIEARFEPAPDTPEGGRFVFVPGRRRRIDALLREEQHARLLWNLIRREDEGGAGAYLYVCGQAGVAVSVMNALVVILARFTPGDDEAERMAEAREILYRLSAERRLLLDVFTTYSGPYQDEHRSFNASEVVLHNSGESGYWLVIDGRVYDMTEFVHLHPGGRQIIGNNAGLDATEAYQGVRHHLNPAVNAMLPMYHIGTIRRLRFNTVWGVTMGPDGLRYVALEDAYRAWVRYLYLIVEMENILASDFSVMRRVTTRGEPAEAMTPLKIQSVAETHQRFLEGYLDDLLGDDLQRIWAMTTGLCDASEAIRRLAIELQAIEETPDARLTRQCAHTIKAFLDRSLASRAPDLVTLDRLRGLCLLVEAQDRRFLARLKLAIREGVMVFEEHEDQTVALGGRRLVEALRQVPGIVREYYASVAAGMRVVEADAGNGTGAAQRRTAAEIRAERGTVLPGHGTVVAETGPDRLLPTSDPLPQ